jgi:hypothetical protein
MACGKQSSSPGPYESALPRLKRVAAGNTLWAEKGLAGCGKLCFVSGRHLSSGRNCLNYVAFSQDGVTGTQGDTRVRL